MPGTTITAGFTVRNEDEIVRDHRLAGLRVMPGVTFLDLVYRALERRGLDALEVAVHDIVFHEPVVTTEAVDRRITLTLGETPRGWDLTATSVGSRDGTPFDATPTLHMTGRVVRQEVDAPAVPTPEALIVAGADDGIELARCYDLTRQLGIEHYDFMRCDGRLFDGPHALWAEVWLSAAANERRDDFFFHPAFLDCSTILPFWRAHLTTAELTLHIPFSIRSFWGTGTRGLSRVYVSVDVVEGRAGSEILHRSFSLWDATGRLVGRFQDFGVKRVRELAVLYRSLSAASGGEPGDGRVVKPTLSVGGAPAPSEAGDVVPQLIRALSQVFARYLTEVHGPLPPDIEFFELGLDSANLLDVTHRLEDLLGVRLYPTMLFEQTSLATLARFLASQHPAAVGQFVARAPVGSDDEPPPTLTPSGDAAAAVSVPSVEAREDAREGMLYVRTWDLRRSAWPSRPRAAAPSASHGRGPVLVVSLSDRADTLGRQLVERYFAAGSAADPILSAAQFVAAAAASEVVAGSRRLVLLGGSAEEVDEAPASHETAFRVVKTLIAAGALRRGFEVTVITFNNVQLHADAPPRGEDGGLIGLCRSLAREYPDCRVDILDYDRSEVDAALTDGDPGWLYGSLWEAHEGADILHVIRHGRCFGERLVALAWNDSVAPAFRRNGCYVLLGGAGGLGVVLGRHLVEHYDARLVVVGRSPLDPTLRARLATVGRLDDNVVYVQGDVQDRDAVARAVAKAKQAFNAVHGVFHMAMVLDDALLLNMTEEKFVRVLAPKVAGILALDRATAGESLDFLVIFSSVQALIGNVGQANYACASTFIDTYAQRMAAQRAHSVVVVNWGYWGSTGAVATDWYRQRVRAEGVASIEPEEGMLALEYIVARALPQVVVVKAARAVLEALGATTRQTALLRSSTAAGALTAPLGSGVAEVASAMRPSLASLRDQIAQEVRAAVGSIHAALLAADERLAGASPGLTLDEAAQAIGTLSKYRRLFAEIVAILARHGLADVRGERVSLTPLARDAGGRGVDRSAVLDLEANAGSETQTALDACRNLLRPCVVRLLDVLRGHLHATDVLFPANNPALVGAVYGDTSLSALYNETVALLAERLLTCRPAPAGASLRVLEVGAGTGATTRVVLDRLRRSGVDFSYTYTDIWARLVEQARQAFGAHPRLRFATLDISEDPQTQGFDEPFDVVIATNVFHATTVIRRSLANVKQLLSRGGTLILNESVEKADFSTLTFGLLDGWWHWRDGEVRLAGSCLVGSDEWERLLREAGFQHVYGHVPRPEGDRSIFVQQVFTAVSDGLAIIPTPAATAPRAGDVGRVVAAKAGAFVDNHLSEVQPADLGLSGPLEHLVLYTDVNGSVWVFLNGRDENTLSVTLVHGLTRVIDALASRLAHSPRAELLYLSHFGRYFSLGGDRAYILGCVSERRFNDLEAYAGAVRVLIEKMIALPAFTVAVVHGSAQGGGFEMLLGTDFQFSSPDVSFGLPEVKSGLMAGMGGVSYLKHRIGPGPATLLNVTGKLISTVRAHELGIISHVSDDPFQAALAFRSEISSKPTALYLRQLLNAGKAELMARDIDTWLAYLRAHTGWLDTRRIQDGVSVVHRGEAAPGVGAARADRGGQES